MTSTSVRQATPQSRGAEKIRTHLNTPTENPSRSKRPPKGFDKSNRAVADGFFPGVCVSAREFYAKLPRIIHNIGKDGICPSNTRRLSRYLCGDPDRKNASVWRWLKQLREAGLVAKVKGGYRIVDPETLFLGDGVSKVKQDSVSEVKQNPGASSNTLTRAFKSPTDIRNSQASEVSSVSSESLASTDEKEVSLPTHESKKREPQESPQNPPRAIDTPQRSNHTNEDANASQSKDQTGKTAVPWKPAVIIPALLDRYPGEDSHRANIPAKMADLEAAWGQLTAIGDEMAIVMAIAHAPGLFLTCYSVVGYLRSIMRDLAQNPEKVRVKGASTRLSAVSRDLQAQRLEAERQAAAKEAAAKAARTWEEIPIPERIAMNRKEVQHHERSAPGFLEAFDRLAKHSQFQVPLTHKEFPLAVSRCEARIADAEFPAAGSINWIDLIRACYDDFGVTPPKIDTKEADRDRQAREKQAALAAAFKKADGHDWSKKELPRLLEYRRKKFPEIFEPLLSDPGFPELLDRAVSRFRSERDRRPFCDSTVCRESFFVEYIIPSAERKALGIDFGPYLNWYANEVSKRRQPN